jgi:hypothetical protein
MALLPLQDGPIIQLITDATYTVGTRVKLDSAGRVTVAVLADRAIGYIDENGATAGQLCGIRVASYPAMTYVRAHSALAVGALLYSQAAGRVDDTDAGSAHVVGFALDAASAQDNVIRMIRVDSDS